MRPFFKTWLTICLLLPLAAHATNREQRLPEPAGHTAKNEKTKQSVKLAKNDTATKTAKPSAAVHKRKTATEARNTRHKSPTLVKNTQNSAKSTELRKLEAAAEAQAANEAIDAKVAELSAQLNGPTQQTRRGKHSDSLVAARNTAAQMSTKQSSEVLSRAVNMLGTPYVYGGTTPKKGFDCSGLVKYAFKDVHSVDLPRTSNAMAEGHGQKVDRKDLKPGDLLFFNIEGRQVNHVAIYLGNDRFIHAPRTGKNVSIDTLDKPYWDEHYVVAKRVLPKQKQAPVLRLSQR
jgi:chitinase